MESSDSPQHILAARLSHRGVRLGCLSPALPMAWSRAALAGQLCELSGGRAAASLTLASTLILDAQREGELVAWIGTPGSSFYPPDFARRGIDLRALIVVWVSDRKKIPAAAAILAQSSAFGLLVLDLGTTQFMAPSDQAWLSGCASRDGVAILCLTRKSEQEPSLGSLVAMRAVSFLKRNSEEHFEVQLRVLKDKKRGPGWEYREVLEGPEGIR